ncbi:glycoside hydrolase 5 family protein [Teredinibacter purpureus]|uniref:glycoside hydrolase 5 family protein n=1 Tax=Teredinibacter purpureus TaxID=2731756 RepID=UPI000695FDF6|nr:cellulase family glycosylhydrolase [Teredinibacter purpureus]
MKRIHLIKHAARLLSVTCAVFLFSACSPSTEQASDEGEAAAVPNSPFVSVVGKQFYVDGLPYSYVGTNMWFAPYIGSEEDDIGDRSRLLNELDFLNDSGITNLRILGASERSPLDNSVSPAIMYKGEIEREDILVGLDFTLAEMAKRNMKAVIFLNNFWEWSGGMVTYLSWVNGGEFINLGDPEHPWPAFALFSAEFYKNEAAVELYHNYISLLLERRNTVTGELYKDDPTIMSWQLANEPRAGNGEASLPNLPYYYDWIRNTASLIKKHAPNQLVSVGSEGIRGCLELDECFLAAHSDNDVDYATFHMWPKNWGWFDVQDPESTFGSAFKNANEYIDHHIKLAEQLNMPLVLEEFGLERDLGAFSPESTTHYRDQFYAFIFSKITHNVHTGGPFIGSNFWAWGGFGKAMHDDAVWRTGDKTFVGDPPQEPQGLNSVFASDASTLGIIKAHYEEIRAR